MEKQFDELEQNPNMEQFQSIIDDINTIQEYKKVYTKHAYGSRHGLEEEADIIWHDEISTLVSDMIKGGTFFYDEEKYLGSAYVVYINRKKNVFDVKVYADGRVSVAAFQPGEWINQLHEKAEMCRMRMDKIRLKEQKIRLYEFIHNAEVEEEQERTRKQ